MYSGYKSFVRYVILFYFKYVIFKKEGKFANIFFQSVAYLFILLINRAKLFLVIFFFFFMGHVFSVISKNSSTNARSQKFSPNVFFHKYNSFRFYI